MYRLRQWFAGLLLLSAIAYPELSWGQTPGALVPFELRGNSRYEREGLHDANNIRTMFFNFGMVGNYPDDPINVDLSIFHSVEVPKGSNENYSDGITPFVLARIIQENAHRHI